MDLSQLRIGNSAGDVKTLEQVKKLAKAPITHIVVGSITVEERAGNPGDTFWVAPDNSYAFNARGLPCQGIDYYRQNGTAMAQVAHDSGKQLIVSIASTQNDDDWRLLAECAVEFADGIEVNISCPNKWKDGKRETAIAESPEAVSGILNEIILAVAGECKLAVKLPPFKTIENNPIFAEMMDILNQHSGGISEVVSCNTLALSTPTVDGKLVLSMPAGGKSGPKLKPWSLMQVRALRTALLDNIDIIGVGGIRSGADVSEYLDAGASGVQVGTHFFQYGARVFGEIIQELPFGDEAA